MNAADIVLRGVDYVTGGDFSGRVESASYIPDELRTARHFERSIGLNSGAKVYRYRNTAARNAALEAAHLGYLVETGKITKEEFQHKLQDIAEDNHLFFAGRDKVGQMTSGFFNRALLGTAVGLAGLFVGSKAAKLIPVMQKDEKDLPITRAFKSIANVVLIPSRALLGITMAVGGFTITAGGGFFQGHKAGRMLSKINPDGWLGNAIRRVTLSGQYNKYTKQALNILENAANLGKRQAHKEGYFNGEHVGVEKAQESLQQQRKETSRQQEQKATQSTNQTTEEKEKAQSTSTQPGDDVNNKEHVSQQTASSNGAGLTNDTHAKIQKIRTALTESVEGLAKIANTYPYLHDNITKLQNTLVKLADQEIKSLAEPPQQNVNVEQAVNTTETVTEAEAKAILKQTEKNFPQATSNIQEVKQQVAPQTNQNELGEQATDREAPSQPSQDNMQSAIEQAKVIGYDNGFGWCTTTTTDPVADLRYVSESLQSVGIKTEEENTTAITTAAATPLTTQKTKQQVVNGA